MDEFWVRLSLIGTTLFVVLVFTFLLRARAGRGPLDVTATGLKQGIYLFSSSECPDCAIARQFLESKLGDVGFDERSWETEPGLFDRLGVNAVPATLIVDLEGTGVLWPGHPDKALAG